MSPVARAPAREARTCPARPLFDSARHASAHLTSIHPKKGQAPANEGRGRTPLRGKEPLFGAAQAAIIRAAQKAIFNALEEAQALFQLVHSPAGAGKPRISCCALFSIRCRSKCTLFPSTHSLLPVEDNSTPDFISWMNNEKRAAKPKDPSLGTPRAARDGKTRPSYSKRDAGVVQFSPQSLPAAKFNAPPFRIIVGNDRLIATGVGAVLS